MQFFCIKKEKKKTNLPYLKSKASFFCISLIVFCGFLFSGCKNNESRWINPEDITYAIKYDQKESTYFLSKINLDTLKIEDEIKLKQVYQFISPDFQGGAFLTQTRSSQVPKNAVYYLENQSRKIQKISNLPSYLPSVIVKGTDEIFVLTGGPSSDDTKLEVLDSNMDHLKTILLQPFSHLSSYAMIFLDEHVMKKNFTNKVSKHESLLYCTESFNNTPTSTNELFLLDLKLKKKILIKNKFLPSYGSISGLALNTAQKKLYVSPLVFLTENNSENEVNKDVLVLSFPKMEIINKIETTDQTHYLIYIEEDKKLYVNHFNGISVIDTVTEKVINKFPFWVNRYSYAGNSKLLASIKTKSGEKKLIIINTQTDKIIKEFQGEYGPILRSLKKWR